MLRAGLRQRQRAAIEFEGRQRSAPAVPMQPARDHQVDREPQPVVETQGNAFTGSPHVGDRVSEECAHRRLHRTQKEGTANRRAAQIVSADASSQRFYIYFDIGEFRHRADSGQLRDHTTESSCRLLPRQFGNPDGQILGRAAGRSHGTALRRHLICGYQCKRRRYGKSH